MKINDLYIDNVVFYLKKAIFVVQFLLSIII